MSSPINEESAAALEWKPHTEVAVIDDPDLPRSISTPATATAPKGRIIDDSARGTIFWEVETESGDEVEAEVDGRQARETTATTTGKATSATASIVNETEAEEAEPETEAEAEAESQQPYGRPFRIQWLSTTRLPFHRTRGLRNPWNSNREVKIARDGTELETAVGRRLIGMFIAIQVSPTMRQGGFAGGGRGQQQQQGQGYQPGRY